MRGVQCHIPSVKAAGLLEAFCLYDSSCMSAADFCMICHVIARLCTWARDMIMLLNATQLSARLTDKAIFKLLCTKKPLPSPVQYGVLYWVQRDWLRLQMHRLWATGGGCNIGSCHVSWMAEADISWPPQLLCHLAIHSSGLSQQPHLRVLQGTLLACIIHTAHAGDGIYESCACCDIT